MLQSMGSQRVGYDKLTEQQHNLGRINEINVIEANETS